MHTFTIVVGSTDGNTLGQEARGDNDDHSRGRKASPVHSDTGITEAHERTARRPLAGR